MTMINTSTSADYKITWLQLEYLGKLKITDHYMCRI